MSFDEIFDLTAGVYFNFIILSKDTFELNFSCFMNPIRFGGNIRIWLLSANHVLRMVNVFFFDRNDT